MATKTRAEIRSRVRFLGTYENSAKYTDALVNDEIQAALGELYEVMDDAHGGYFDTETTSNTTANQAYVDLPSDFWRLRGVDVLVGGRYVPLDQIGIEQRNDYQSTTGRPMAYRTIAGGARGRLQLHPTPSGIDTLRIIYTPTCPVFASDAGSFEFYQGFDDYVVEGTLLRLAKRAERDLGEHQQELARIKDRIQKGAARRRAAAPQYLASKEEWPLDFDLYWST